MKKCCMFGTHRPLGSAQVRWNDYVGTAAADDADAVLATPSLYELTGLDRELWIIVAIDLSMGSPEHVIVYAADSTQDLAESEAVRVTAFHLEKSVRLHEFMENAFKRVSVRLLSSRVSGSQLLVADDLRPAAAE